MFFECSRCGNTLPNPTRKRWVCPPCDVAIEQAIRLRVDDSYSYASGAELAAELGIKRDALYQRVRRMRKRDAKQHEV